jgi:hypothetical protein
MTAIQIQRSRRIDCAGSGWRRRSQADHGGEERRPGQEEVAEQDAEEEPGRAAAGHRAGEAADVLADEERGHVRPAVRIGEADRDPPRRGDGQHDQRPRDDHEAPDLGEPALDGEPGEHDGARQQHRHRALRQHTEPDHDVHQREIPSTARVVAHREHEARERE